MTETATQVVKVPRQHHAQRQGGAAAGLQWLFSVIVIAAFVMTFIVQAFVIPSDSMENTLMVGDYVLVDKIDYANGGLLPSILPYGKVKRGDIIVFRYPVHPNQHFVKRVIGIPGDRIHMINKRVYVNRQPLTEPYAIYKPGPTDHYRDDFPDLQYFSGNVESKWWAQMQKLVENGNLIVPEGHYFVMGDNRDDSLDSRYWGFVPAENVVGRPLLIYWSITSHYDDNADNEVNETRSAKLTRLIYGITRLFRDARWNRTMKVVR